MAGVILRDDMKIKITYSGTPHKKCDDILLKQAKQQGDEFIGCGYNFKTNIRDLEFRKIYEPEK